MHGEVDRVIPLLTSVVKKVCDKEIKEVKDLAVVERDSGRLDLACVHHPLNPLIAWTGKTQTSKTFTMCLNLKSSQPDTEWYVWAFR